MPKTIKEVVKEVELDLLEKGELFSKPYLLAWQVEFRLWDYGIEVSQYGMTIYLNRYFKVKVKYSKVELNMFCTNYKLKGLEVIFDNKEDENMTLLDYQERESNLAQSIHDNRMEEVKELHALIKKYNLNPQDFLKVYNVFRYKDSNVRELYEECLDKGILK